MSLNKAFGDSMDAAVAQLVEKGVFDKATAHVTYGVEAVNLPEGITEESMKNHVNFINETASAVEVATAQIARDQYATNDKLSSVDATFSFGGFDINSQHNLRQQIEEDYVYGQGTTAVDYRHSDDLSSWMADQRENSVAQATKLFG